MIHRKVGLRHAKALFRSADGRPFDLQRRDLRRRLEGARERLGGARPRAPVPELAHVYLLEFDPTVPVSSAQGLYARDPHVTWAQPNYRAEPAFVPDDPFFFSSGSWGQPFDDLWGLKRIRVEPAWLETTGEGVIVAVVDSGVDFGHLDLRDNAWVNPGEDLDGNGVADAADRNGIDDDGNGFVDDLNGFDFASGDADTFDDLGHGSHVAGTIAAVGGNGTGVVGVAPGARIMAVRGLTRTGGSIADLSRGIAYAAEQGAHVINNSWSCTRPCPRNPIAEDAVKLAHALGSVLVFSAGNKATDVDLYSPQNMRETIVVSASDPGDEPASFTSFGFPVTLIAPGAGFHDAPPDTSPQRGILSTLSSGSTTSIDGGGLYVVGEQYVRLAGTSMSAPHVAGVAALVRARRPELANEDVRNALRVSARDLGRPGHDPDNGAGLVDTGAAVALDPVPHVRSGLRTPESLQVLVQSQGPIPIEGTASGDDFTAYALFYGIGTDPDAWVPIGVSRDAPVVDGPLDSWEIEPLGDGPYVIRLLVWDVFGNEFEEFTRVALERNPPRRISPLGFPAHVPDVSGDRIVWEQDSLLGEGSDVHMHDLGLDSTHVIASGPLDQYAPRISNELVVWRDSGSRPAIEYAIFGCRFDQRSGSCPTVPIATGPDFERDVPDVSGARVVWSDSSRDPNYFGLLTCELHGAGRRCRPHTIGEGERDFSTAAIDGDRIVWGDSRDGGQDLYTCLLGRDCEARPLDIPGHLEFDPDVSGDLIVWSDIRSHILLCDYDEQTGSCPAQTIVGHGGASTARIGGRRVTWHARTEQGDFDVFFCEYDSLTRTCSAQQMRHPAHQFNPQVDGDRIVWVDWRDGESRVFALDLPRLEFAPGRTVGEGELLRLPVTGSDGLGPLALRAQLADGRSVDAVGARFDDFGDGSGLLEWRPELGQTGSHVFRFTGTGIGHLETTGHAAVDVISTNRPPQVVVRPHLVGRIDTPLEADACESRDPDGDALTFVWRDAAGSVLGTGCRIALPPPPAPAREGVEVEASDGSLFASAPVKVRWLAASPGTGPH